MNKKEFKQICKARIPGCKFRDNRCFCDNWCELPDGWNPCFSGWIIARWNHHTRKADTFSGTHWDSKSKTKGKQAHDNVYAGWSNKATADQETFSLNLKDVIE